MITNRKNLNKTKTYTDYWGALNYGGYLK